MFNYIILICYLLNYLLGLLIYNVLGIGDWGLGIGPNPQSPIPNPHNFNINYIINYNINYNINIYFTYINFTHLSK